MSRKFSEERPSRLASMIAGLLSVAALAACSSGAGTTSTGTTAQEQALTEAQSSYDTAKQTAEACFTAFDACKSAAGADVAACETTLHDCLPAKAGAGPHCGDHDGKGKGPGGPPGGDCDGGAPPPPPSGSGAGGPPPPPPPPSGSGSAAPPAGTPPGGPGGPPPGGGGRPNDNDADDAAGGGGKGHPDFCKQVPLPLPPELKACHDANDACIKGGSDPKTCFDADRACVKAAFDAAFQALCAKKDTICADTSAPAGACDRITKLCAGGIAPPPPPPN